SISDLIIPNRKRAAKLRGWRAQRSLLGCRGFRLVRRSSIDGSAMPSSFDTEVAPGGRHEQAVRLVWLDADGAAETPPRHDVPKSPPVPVTLVRRRTWRRP